MTIAGISSRYAQALVDVITAPGTATDPHAELSAVNSFVELLTQGHDLELVLLSPSVSMARKRFVLGKIAEALQMSRMVTNFLLVINDHRRMSILRPVAEAAAILLDEKLGFLRANVTSAAPLSDDDRQRIAGKLTGILGKQIRVNASVDPGLIGGIVARVGSLVYDGSVQGRLRTLGERLALESR